MVTVNRKYQVGGLFSQDDAYQIQDTLGQMKSVENVQVDQNAQQVSFAFDSGQIDESFIMSTLNTLGYSFQGEQK